MPDDWPSFEQVFSCRIPTKKYVPKRARSLWSECLTVAIADVCQHNDLKAWIQLLSLPKMVLRASNRGGKKNKKKTDTFTRDRCNAWLEGRRSFLWKPERSNRKFVDKKLDEPELEEKVSSLVQEMLYHKACSTLTNEPPVAVTPEVVSDMREKHPRARAGEDDRVSALRPVHGSAVQDFTQEEMEKAILSFPKDSAAGPSSMRPQHLKDALVPGLKDEVLGKLQQLVQLLARGDAPASVHSWISGGSLVALRKKDGGLRPIAVGETWRRLVSKVLVSSCADDASTYLQPLQIGVGTPNGCESVVHVVRQWCGRHQADHDRVLALMDLSNAFNSVDRSAFREAVRRVAPSLAPWVDYCYGGSGNLLLGAEVIDSERGIQQGDPLGPLLFSLAIHEHIKQAAEEVERRYPGELDFKVFYLDDGVAAGSSRAVRLFCTLLEASFADIGLILQRDKCEIIPAAGINNAIPPTLFQGFVFNVSRNFKLLGAPFGSKEFCEHHTGKRREKAVALLQRVANLQDTQCAMHLVRQCASFCKLAYSIRAVPPSLHENSLKEFSTDMRYALQQMMSSHIDDAGWTQARLGIKAGGLGLRGAHDHAAAAFLSSTMACRNLCASIDQNFDYSDSANDLGLAETRSAFLTQVLPDAVLDLDGSSRSQKFLSRLIDAKIEQNLANNGNLAYKAHLGLQSLPGAGAWLIAPPSEDDLKLDPTLCKISLQRRLRQQVQNTDTFCPMCGGTMDTFGDHAITCSCKGDRTVRHNAIRNVTHKCAQEANMSPEREKANLLPARPPGDLWNPEASSGTSDRRRRRPADIFLPRGTHGSPMALDFAATSGMQSSVLRQSADDPTTVVVSYEQRKKDFVPEGETDSTESLCNRQGFSFTPMVLDAHGGGMGKDFRMVVDAIGKQAATVSGLRSDFQSFLIAQRISVTLQRENARAILRRRVERGVDDEPQLTQRPTVVPTNIWQ